MGGLGDDLDIGQGAVQLPARSHQGVDVLDGQDIVEAGAHGAGHGVEGLAGGVRHQMQVEIGGDARVGHTGAAACDKMLLGTRESISLLTEAHGLGDS